MTETVDLAQKFGLFKEHWRPKIIGELNDSYVKLAKLKVNSSGTSTRMRMSCSW